MIRKLTVLLVEDEWLVRQTLQIILQRYADEITVIGEARNGREAIALIESQHPDVIISDIVMPQMNGLELLSYVHEHYSDIHTIILSGYSDFPYVKSAFQQGIIDYILKPELSPESLIACLRKVIDQKKLGSSQRQDDPCEQLLAYIREKYMEPLTLQEAARKLHLSYSSISAKFSLSVGKGFKEALNDVRIEKARKMLADTDMSVLDIALSVGYTDQSYFCKVFKTRTGDSPLAYRNRWKRSEK